MRSNKTSSLPKRRSCRKYPRWKPILLKSRQNEMPRSLRSMTTVWTRNQSRSFLTLTEIQLRLIGHTSRAKWLRTSNEEMHSEKACRKKGLITLALDRFTMVNYHPTSSKTRTCTLREATTGCSWEISFSSRCLSIWEKINQLSIARSTSNTSTQQCLKPGPDSSRSLLTRETKIKRILTSSMPTWTRRASFRS